MRRGRPAVLLLGAALAGCAGNQRLLGRYDHAVCQQENQPEMDCGQAVPTMEVSAVLAPKAPAASSGTVLPERAMSHYVAAMAGFSRDADGFRRNVAAPLDPPAEPPPFVDRSAFAGTLFLTARYTGPFNPSDRIERLYVSLTLRSGTVVSWTGARTVFTDIAPGKIESTGKVSLTGGLDIKAPGPVPVGGTLSASTDRTRTETLQVVQHVEDLTVSVEPPSTVTISRRGGFGIDLVGNAQVDVVLTANDAQAQDATLFRISGYDRAADPGALAVSRARTRLSREKLLADISAEYVVRHVLRGGGTAEEGDDSVRYMTRHTTAREVTLAPASGTSWGLASLTEGVGDLPLYLSIQDPSPERRGKAIALCFGSEAEAQALLDYLGRLRREPRRLGGFAVGLGRSFELEDHIGPLTVAQACVRG